jgi:uncharacterized membrane protein
VDPPKVPLYKSRLGGSWLKIDSKDLSLIAAFAALYAALVYFFVPLSFYTLQFRIAGIARPAIAKKWMLSIGYAIGVVVGNLLSPFVGLYELLFMPFMSFMAGILGYIIARKFKGNYFIAGFVISTVIALSVSWMLNQLFSLAMPLTFPFLWVSEQVICFIGASIMKLVDLRFKWWQ